MVKPEEVWEHEAEKAGGKALVSIIRYLRDGQNAILGKLDKQTEAYQHIELRMEAFIRAFPAKDIDGHRRYHELMIETMAAKNRFYKALFERLAIGGVSALAVFVVGAVLLAIKTWFWK